MIRRYRRILLARLIYRILRVRNRWLRPVTVGVRVIAVMDDQVVLVRHTYIPGWFLPGGGIHRGETLEAAARREAREEAGLELGPLRLFGTYSNFGEYKSDHVSVFLGNVESLSGEYDHEIAEVRLYPQRQLPVGTHAATARRLAEYQAGTHPLHGYW